jgi:hypothetical protein
MGLLGLENQRTELWSLCSGIVLQITFVHPLEFNSY